MERWIMYVDFFFVHLIAIKHIVPQILITVMHPNVSFLVFNFLFFYFC